MIRKFLNRFARDILIAKIREFVKKQENRGILRDIDLPEAEIAEYIVDLLLGEKTIMPNDRDKFSQAVEVIRRSIYR